MRDPHSPLPFMDLLALRNIARRYVEDQRNGTSAADARQEVLRATATAHPDRDAATILRIAEREVFRPEVPLFPLPAGRDEYRPAPPDPELRRRLVTPLLPVAEDEECTAPDRRPQRSWPRQSYASFAAA